MVIKGELDRVLNVNVLFDKQTEPVRVHSLNLHKWSPHFFFYRSKVMMFILGCHKSGCNSVQKDLEAKM